MKADCTKLTECVACGSNKLKLVLDLKRQPLANSYKLNKDDWQPEFPLAINRCEECYHVQLTHAVDPSLMFEDYLYVSGTTQTGHKHFEDFASLVHDMAPESDTVLDVGCNDGTQLDYFKILGYDTYGVDPAKNLHDLSNKNHSVACGYFNDEFAEKAFCFDVITAQNVFAHTADPLSFLKTASKVMHEDSLLFIQTSQANMIVNNEFDTIYHEHISFFNTLSMKKLCERAGLYLIDVTTMPIHGTSYVFIISKKDLKGSLIEQRLEDETANGLYQPETYVKYANYCNAVVKELVEVVSRMTSNEVGWYGIGYGAPAKGMTLLNYSSLKLDFIIDDNPLKQGRFTPGSSIPIYSSEKLKELDDTVCFVPLAWNFYDEIVKKIKAARSSSKHSEFDRYVTYFPKVEIRE
jgi:2-polyprenyl-3-methyl-5-hydroxy-6-metoxy-1,4-benzoquinol methylase